MGQILIVDADAAALRLLAEALSLDGHEILTAPSAAGALALLASRVPDLLILDLRTGGFELLTLREGPARALPAIMLGTAIPEETVRRGWELGVDSYQSKNEEALPLLAGEIRIKVRRLLQSRAEWSPGP